MFLDPTKHVFRFGVLGDSTFKVRFLGLFRWSRSDGRCFLQRHARCDNHAITGRDTCWVLETFRSELLPLPPGKKVDFGTDFSLKFFFSLFFSFFVLAPHWKTPARRAKTILSVFV